MRRVKVESHSVWQVKIVCSIGDSVPVSIPELLRETVLQEMIDIAHSIIDRCTIRRDVDMSDRTLTLPGGRTVDLEDAHTRDEFPISVQLAEAIDKEGDVDPAALVGAILSLEAAVNSLRKDSDPSRR